MFMQSVPQCALLLFLADYLQVPSIQLIKDKHHEEDSTSSEGGLALRLGLKITQNRSTRTAIISGKYPIKNRARVW